MPERIRLGGRLWEYDNIIKSLYLLDYVDSVPLRQNVQRALNRGESYHQLRRAVSYANVRQACALKLNMNSRSGEIALAC